MKRFLQMLTRNRKVTPVAFGNTDIASDPELWVPQNVDSIPETDAEVETDVATEAELAPETDSLPSDIESDVDAGPPADPDNDAPDPQLQAAYEEGRQAALEEQQAEVDAIRTRFSHAIRDVHDLANQLSGRYRAEAVELATAMAKAVVGAEIRTDPEILKGILDRAMEAVPEGAKEVVIRCHPDDLEFVKAHLPELQAGREAPIVVRTGASDKLERGGCVIQFDEGAIDSRPSVSVDVLREAVEAQIAGRGSVAPAASPPREAQRPDAKGNEGD